MRNLKRVLEEIASNKSNTIIFVSHPSYAFVSIIPYDKSLYLVRVQCVKIIPIEWLELPVTRVLLSQVKRKNNNQNISLSIYSNWGSQSYQKGI